MNKLKGKVAVITGGSSGIGLATAQEFIEQGAQVIITGRNQERLDAAIAQLGSENAVAISSDVSNIADLDRLAASVKERYGKLDVLFANAGIAHFRPIDQVDEDFFDATFNTNVKGVFFLIQKLSPLFSEAGGSIIINATTMIHFGSPASSIYSASKAAVRSFARTLSAELKDRGIRINVVSPGPIETPIFGKMGIPEEQLNEMAKGILSQVPLQRFGKPEEIAKTVLFLASEDSSYVLGAEILADGGMATV